MSPGRAGSGPSTPGARTCGEGHPVEAHFSYCPTCGAPLDDQVAPRPHPGLTSTPELSAAGALARYRSWLLVGALVVLVALISVLAGGTGAPAGSSWKDGYAAGQRAWTGTKAAGGAAPLCERVVATTPLPVAENRVQFARGCRAGYQAAARAGAP